MKFRKGDIITGNVSSLSSAPPYAITTREALMKVTCLRKESEYMEVKVLDHCSDKYTLYYIGRRFTVQCEHFKKISKLERILRFDK